MRKGLIRVLPLSVAVATAAVLSALLPGAVAAGTPAPVIFENNVHVESFTPGPGCFAVYQTPGIGCPTDVLSKGTATATGAVDGGFTVVEDGQVAPGPALKFDEVFTSDVGTITIGVQARFVGGTATTTTVAGNWTIVTGSGTYANLHGNGTYDATVDFAAAPHTISETLTGFAVFGAGS